MMNELLIATLRDMWGLVYESRRMVYEELFFRLRDKGIAFGWFPRTSHVFIGENGCSQEEFKLSCTHDEAGWAVAELAGIGENKFYWNGFTDCV